MIDLGANSAYIVAAYGVSALGLLALVAYTFRRRG